MIAMTAPDENGNFIICGGNVNGQVSWGHKPVTIPMTTKDASFAENFIIYTRYGAVTQTTHDPLPVYAPYEEFPEMRCLR